jgi:hypothetical protein
VALISFIIVRYKLGKDGAEVFGSIATGVGLFFISLSVLLALDAYKKNRQASEFTVINSIQQRLNNQRSYRIRGYLHSKFPTHLTESVKNIFNNIHISGEHVTVEEVLRDLKEPQPKEKEIAFIDELRNKETSIDKVKALEAVESTLLDFDLLAVPYYRNIEAVKDAAEMYKNVFQATAEKILPFVAIMQRLRCDRDPYYKKHYICLLEELGINTQGISVPCKPITHEQE